MGLVELGRHTGLSSAMLSKIERARLFPTLPTLLRIAMVFNVGLEHFFTDGRHVVAVARKEDRLVFEEKFGGNEVAYRFECLDFNAGDRRLNAFYAEFPKTARRRVSYPRARWRRIHLRAFWQSYRQNRRGGEQAAQGGCDLF